MALYAQISEAKKPKEIKIHSRDQSVIHVQTNYIGAAGDVITPASDRKYIEYGGEKVVLSAPEIAEAKRSCGVEGIHLLGFRPTEDIQRWLQMGRLARFMYPEDEATQAGATAAFTALVEAMAAKDRVGIAAYARTDDRSAGVRCCALIPAHAGAGAGADAGAVTGLHVVELPFLDDVRHPERAHATRGDTAVGRGAGRGGRGGGEGGDMGEVTEAVPGAR